MIAAHARGSDQRLQRCHERYAPYEIEADVRGCSAKQRRGERQARAQSLVDTLKPGLEHRFKTMGRIERPTVLVSIKMRPSSRNRQSPCQLPRPYRIASAIAERPETRANGKNAMFAGSDEGGANWATIVSLIETAKLNGVNPHVWLNAILTQLVNRWSGSGIDERLPCA